MISLYVNLSGRKFIVCKADVALHARFVLIASPRKQTQKLIKQTLQERWSERAREHHLAMRSAAAREAHIDRITYELTTYCT